MSGQYHKHDFGHGALATFSHVCSVAWSFGGVIMPASCRLEVTEAARHGHGTGWARGPAMSPGVRMFCFFFVYRDGIDHRVVARRCGRKNKKKT